MKIAGEDAINQLCIAIKELAKVVVVSSLDAVVEQVSNSFLVSSATSITLKTDTDDYLLGCLRYYQGKLNATQSSVAISIDSGLYISWITSINPSNLQIGSNYYYRISYESTSNIAIGEMYIL